MMSSPSKEVYPAVVIGGGPAGLSAATWIARHRYEVLIIDSGEYRNRWVDLSHGFFGSDPVSPNELIARARSDLKQYDQIELLEDKVSTVSQLGPSKFRLAGDDFEVQARRLVIATGVVDRFPEIDGFFEHYGADVFHCPLCDGYEAENKHVAVLGWTKGAGDFAVEMQRWAASVTMVTDPNTLDEDEGRRLEQSGVKVIEDSPDAFEGVRGDLHGIRLAGGDVVPCSMVFFSLTDKPVAHLAAQLGCEQTEEGPLAVDGDGKTSVEGVYAAGDITPGEHLIALAVAKGTMAGLACARSLADEGVPTS